VRTAIFGGSFNPVHKGHVNMARAAYNEMGLDRVIVVPSHISPQKSEADYIGVTDRQRFDMCALAFEKEEGFEVSDFEIKRQEKSYTFYTLCHFEKLYPEDKFYLVIGSDSLYYFDRWYRFEEIMKRAELIVMAREEGEYEKLRNKAESLVKYGKINILDCEAFPISSTILRQNLSDLKDCTCYLDEKVVKYIVANRLYR